MGSEAVGARAVRGNGGGRARERGKGEGERELKEQTAASNNDNVEQSDGKRGAARSGRRK